VLLLLLLALLRAVLLLLLALLRVVLLRLMLRVCRILISSVAVLLTSCVIDLASTLAPPLPPCPAPAGTVREGELREGELREGELRPIGSCAAGAAGSLTFSCTRCSLSVSLEQCCVSRFCSSLLWTISAASDASRSLSALLSCS
jgi:hypothetical protein